MKNCTGAIFFRQSKHLGSWTKPETVLGKDLRYYFNKYIKINSQVQSIHTYCTACKYQIPIPMV